jgi:hypothetical protein
MNNMKALILFNAIVMTAMFSCSPVGTGEAQQSSHESGQATMPGDTSTCVFTTEPGKVLVVSELTRKIAPEPRGYYDFVAEYTDGHHTIKLFHDAYGHDDEITLRFSNTDDPGSEIRDGVYVTGNEHYGNGTVSISGTYHANGVVGEKKIAPGPGQKIYIKKIPGTDEAYMIFCNVKMDWRYGEDSFLSKGLHTGITLNGSVIITLH